MAILHVKSPNGTSYNMTIVTSGTTESLQQNGWYRSPSGFMIQWGYAVIITTVMGENFPVITFPTGFPVAAMSCGCTTVGAWLCHSNPDGSGSCVYGATTLEAYQGGQNIFLIGMLRSDGARVEVGVHWHATGY